MCVYEKGLSTYLAAKQISVITNINANTNTSAHTNALYLYN